VDLLVRGQVHEDEVVAVGVQVLHRALVDAGRLHLRTGVEGLVHDLAGEHVLQRGAHERAALAGLDVLKLDDGPQLAVQVEHQTVLEVVRRRHGKKSSFRSRRRLQGANLTKSTG
jgi:hypothetical protein